MATITQVTLSEILEISNEPIQEFQSWTLIRQLSYYLLSLFRSDKYKAKDNFPLNINPSTIQLTSDGQLNVNLNESLRENSFIDDAYLPPEFHAPYAELINKSALEKIYVYSLAKCIRKSLQTEKSTSNGLEVLLKSMTEENFCLRSSLESVIKISTEPRNVSLDSDTVILTHLYKVVMGSCQSIDVNDLSMLVPEPMSKRTRSRSRPPRRRSRSRSRSRSHSRSRRKYNEDIDIASYYSSSANEREESIRTKKSFQRIQKRHKQLETLRGGNKDFQLEDPGDSSEIYNMDQSTGNEQRSMADRPLTRNAWPRMSTPRIAQTSEATTRPKKAPNTSSTTTAAPASSSILRVNSVPDFLRLNNNPTVNLQIPPAKNATSSSLCRRVQVTLPCGDRLMVICDPHYHTGDQLYQTVADHCNIQTEKPYYGITHVIDNEHYFLDSSTKLYKIAPDSWSDRGREVTSKGHQSYIESPPIFSTFLRVKFYVANADTIGTIACKHRYYIQHRKDVLDGYIRIQSDEFSIHLAALAIRAEIGNIDIEKLQLNCMHYVSPECLQRLGNARTKEAISAALTTISGDVVADRAETEFLKEMQHLPECGVHYYHVKYEKKSSGCMSRLYCGVGMGGVVLTSRDPAAIGCSERLRAWCDVTKLSFNRKRFSVTSRGLNSTEKISCYTHSFKRGKYLLDLCRQHHAFQIQLQLNKPQTTGETIQTMELSEQAEGSNTSQSDYALSDTPCRPNVVTLVKSQQDDSGIQLAGAGHRGYFYVKTLAKDSSAYRDGRINPGDRLVKVDEVSVANEPYHVVNRMVKAIGQTEVTLMFDHCTTQKMDMGKYAESSSESPSDEIYTKNAKMEKVEKIIQTRKRVIQLSKINNSLGFTVVGGFNSTRGNAIRVKTIAKDGAAEIDGNLKIGDEVLEINGRRLKDKSHAEAVIMMRRAPANCRLVVKSGNSGDLQRPTVPTEYGYEFATRAK